MLPFRPDAVLRQQEPRLLAAAAGRAGAARCCCARLSSLANDQPWSFLVIVLIATITGFSITLILSVIYRQLISRSAAGHLGRDRAGRSRWRSVSMPSSMAGCISLYRPDSECRLRAAVPRRVLSRPDAARRMVGALLRDQLLPPGRGAERPARCGWKRRRPARSSRCCATSSTRTSCSTRSIRSRTLVLLKQTEPANAMLSRLSSFLRYTLVNEPTGAGHRGAGGRDAEALSRHRTDALRGAACAPNSAIDPDARERAAALAAAPAAGRKRDQICRHARRKKAPRSRIAAQLVGPTAAHHRVRHRAGLADGRRSATGCRGSTLRRTERTVSTGVGLANIRDRLAQAYGEEHRFEIRDPPEGGFAVMIELPFEAAEESGRAPRIAAAADGPSHRPARHAPATEWQQDRMTIRTILVDDEKLAIQGLQLRLEKFADVEIIDTCSNGREAIRKIKTEKPDLVFLDIQMPGFDGFSRGQGRDGDRTAAVRLRHRLFRNTRSARSRPMRSIT